MKSDDDNHKTDIIKLLKFVGRPLSIADIKRELPTLSPILLRTTLGKLEGEGIIESFKIGRATVHRLK